MKTVLVAVVSLFFVGSCKAFSPLVGSTRCASTSLDAVRKQASLLSTTSTKSGPAVDLNKYNLPMDTIVEEWVANLTPESDLESEGVYLGARSPQELMVDTIQVGFARTMGTGLGIMLQEIAGGRGDGLGITVVTGLVEGGAADGSGIVEGDCLSKVAIKRRAPDAQEFEELASVSTECLGYDATVEAILSLPPPQHDNEIFFLTLKRLRRKPAVKVFLEYPPSQGEPSSTIELFSGENLRRAMLKRGVKLNDPLSRRFDSGGSGDCGAEGTCTTCVVSIIRGGELLNPIGTQEQQMLADNPRWRLACKTIVGHGYQEGDLRIRVNPKQWED